MTLQENKVLQAWELRGGGGEWGLVAHVLNRFGVELVVVLLDFGYDSYYDTHVKRCRQCLPRYVGEAVTAMLERGVAKVEVAPAESPRHYYGPGLLVEVVSASGRTYVACARCKPQSGEWCAVPLDAAPAKCGIADVVNHV